MTEATTVLVTGASGFIASHCIIQLLDKGYRVRGTLRSLDRADGLRQVIASQTDPGDRLEFVVADLKGDDGWGQAVTGCSHVLHVASPIPRTAPKHPDELIVPARDGALRVLKAAAAAGVKRVVMTASTAAICYGHGNIGRPFTEEDWSDPDGADNSAYTRSKTIAERAAWDFIEQDASGLELVTINPGAVLGPVLEADYGTSAEIVVKLMNGDFPGTPRMGFPLVDVRDVADIHIRAMEQPEAAGNRFMAANEFMWMADVAAVLRQHRPDYARKIPTRGLPSWLVRTISLFDSVTRSVTFELDVRRDVTSDKARRMLGWSPRSNEEAIKATADSVVALGIV